MGRNGKKMNKKMIKERITGKGNDIILPFFLIIFL